MDQKFKSPSTVLKLIIDRFMAFGIRNVDAKQ